MADKIALALLDQSFDIYDEHLKFLEGFDDIRPEVEALSRSFVSSHDAMVAAMANDKPFTLDEMHQVFSVADRIMSLVHLKRGGDALDAKVIEQPMAFLITPEQQKKALKWLHSEVYPKVIEQQKERFKQPDPMIALCWAEGYPYEGAIGGGISYEFSPTSVGMVVRMRYGEFVLDLTEYGDW